MLFSVMETQYCSLLKESPNPQETTQKLCMKGKLKNNVLENRISRMKAD